MMQLKSMNGERRAGKIITMSSGIGQKGGAGGATIVHYVTAKAGIIGFTKALAGELAPLITVNSISPDPPHGYPRRPHRGMEAREGKTIPARLRHGRGRALTAVFLASPDSDYYTGQVLMPNGGDVLNG